MSAASQIPANQVVVQARPLGRHKVFVVDGLFEADFVRVIHESLKQQQFFQSDFDTPETTAVRHWRLDFSLADLAKNPLTRTLRDRIAAKTAELYPDESGALRQVYANNSSYGDHLHAHVDGADGLTALYFANAEWHDDWQGETTLFDRPREPFYAVAPRPGRVLLFPAKVLHRAGTPSRTCMASRLTLVFKFDGARSSA